MSVPTDYPKRSDILYSLALAGHLLLRCHAKRKPYLYKPPKEVQGLKDEYMELVNLHNSVYALDKPLASIAHILA